MTKGVAEKGKGYCRLTKLAFYEQQEAFAETKPKTFRAAPVPGPGTVTPKQRAAHLF